MIQKTKEEKEQLRQAKKAYKKAMQIANHSQYGKTTNLSIKQDKPTIIEFEKGEELPDDYPVNWNYIYYANDKLIRSDIKGTVITLKRDLIKTFNYLEDIKIYRAIHKY